MLNHIAIMGRLVSDPELKVTNSGKKVCGFRIACDRDYADADGNRNADFVDCVAWRGTAEFLTRNFRKGQPILVSGRLQVREYTDKDDNKRRAVEVVADQLYFAGGERRESSAPAAAQQFTELEGDFSDMPFEMGDGEPLPL